MDKGGGGRDEEQHALLSLILASMPEGGRIADDLAGEFDFRPAPLREALPVLARFRQEPARVLRPMIFKSLGRLARNDPGALAEHEEQLGILHEALAVEAGIPPDQLVDVTGRMRESLAILEPGETTDDGFVDDPPTQTYYATSAALLNAPLETVAAPPCDDDDEVPGYPGGAAVEIEWFTPIAIHKFRPWTNPMHWPECDGMVFFKSMKMLDYANAPGAAWSGDYRETVEIVPGNPIVAELHFDHVEDPNSGSPKQRITSDYWLSNPPSPGDDLTLDQGALTVEAQVDAAGAPVTRVSLAKIFAFGNPTYQRFPQLACETFFGEIAVAMASNCAQGYGTSP